jgi:hypothetical protein
VWVCGCGHGHLFCQDSARARKRPPRLSLDKRHATTKSRARQEALGGKTHTHTHVDFNFEEVFMHAQHTHFVLLGVWTD